MKKITALFIAISMMCLVGVSAFAEEVKPAAAPAAAAAPAPAPEADKVTGSVAAGAYSQYVFRGYELSRKSFVIQPSVTVSYKGFSINAWGNIDSKEHATQSMTAPDRPGHKSFNETDLTFNYTYSIDKLSLTAGYIYYATRYVAETEEVYLSATYDIISKPTISVYRDIAAYPGTYVNLSFSHSEPVYKIATGDVTVDLGAAFGYYSYSDEAFRTLTATGYDGKKYSAFHDGMVKAGLTVPLGKNFAVQPIIQYWFPLSSKASRKIDGVSYNPAGHVDKTVVYGLGLTFNF